MELNAEQMQAVTWPPAPGNHLALIAGPGTGKTRTLVARIEYLLNELNIPARDILALTFTRKAVAEIRERLGQRKGVKTDVAGATAKIPTVSTFHALGLNILQELKIPVTLATDAQRSAALKEALAGMSIKLKLRDAATMLSRIKAGAEKDKDGLAARYDIVLKRQNLCDYEDLLLQALEQIKAGTYKHTYIYVLVDELQDTSPVELQLIFSLLAPQGQLFCVGDPRQAIYGFRGAAADPFQILEDKLSEASGIKKLNLTQNYRSHKQIVAAANAVFPQYEPLQAMSGDPAAAISAPQAVQLIRTLGIYAQADYIISQVETVIAGSDWLESAHEYQNTAAGEAAPEGTGSFKDFAVLFRRHRDGLILEQKLYEAGLPFQSAGESALFTRPVIVRLISDLQASSHYFRINEAVDALALPKTPKEVLEVAEFKNFLQSLPPLPGASKKSGGISTGQNMYSAELAALLSKLKTLEQHDYYDEGADKITLLTLHSAKGLEFPRVFILNFSDGSIPDPKGDPDEELRLFYVGLTRAREQITLLHPGILPGGSGQGAISLFSSFLYSLGITPEDDPALSSQQKRRIRAKAKKAQISLI